MLNLQPAALIAPSSKLPWSLLSLFLSLARCWWSVYDQSFQAYNYRKCGDGNRFQERTSSFSLSLSYRQLTSYNFDFWYTLLHTYVGTEIDILEFDLGFWLLGAHQSTIPDEFSRTSRRVWRTPCWRWSRSLVPMWFSMMQIQLCLSTCQLNPSTDQRVSSTRKFSSGSQCSEQWPHSGVCWFL